MNRGKELAKNTIILFIGTFFTKLIQYLLLPVYTGYLSTSQYGQYELYSTIITLLLPIIGLQIDQGVFRFLISNRNEKDKTNKIISSSLFFILLSIMFYFILFILINRYIVGPYKWLLVVNVILNSLSSLLLQVSRGIGNNKEYAISNCITSLFTIGFNILFIVGIGLKVDGMLYGSALGYFIGIIYLFFKIKMYNYISLKYIDKKSLKEIIKYSLPMIPNSLSWWVFSSSDRVIISYFIGYSANGILSIAYKFSNILIVLYNVFNMSLTESISLHIDDGDIEQYFNSIFQKIGNLFISFGTLLISFMPIIFKILINDSFIGAYDLIPIAVLATIMQVYSGMLGTIYVAKNNTKSIALTSIIAAIVNIVFDLLLVKFIGVYAAVASTLISFVILYIYRIFDVNKRYFNIKNNRNFVINICCFIILLILYYFSNLICIIISIVFSLLMLYVINKDNIRFIIEFLKRKKARI